MADRFYGTFTPRLDGKGRVTLPARYRRPFAEGAMVVRGDARCLYVFTVAEFDEFAEDAINAPVTDTRRIGPSRYMLANSDLQMPDAQGRIMLAPRMREYAELDRDVVLTGAGRRMEIWNVDRWNAYEAAQEAGYIDPSGLDPDPSTPAAAGSAAGSGDEPTAAGRSSE